MREVAAISLTASGFALILGGVAYVYWPAAVIVAGLSLAALGLLVLDVK